MMPEKLDSSIVLLRERIEQGMRGSADLILDEFELAGVKAVSYTHLTLPTILRV